MKAVLVFCEGRHDIVFAQRSLGTHGDCDWVDKPISELPSPFGSSLTESSSMLSEISRSRALYTRRCLPSNQSSRTSLPVRCSFWFAATDKTRAAPF